MNGKRWGPHSDQVDVHPERLAYRDLAPKYRQLLTQSKWIIELAKCPRCGNTGTLIHPDGGEACVCKWCAEKKKFIFREIALTKITKQSQYKTGSGQKQQKW